MRDLEKKISRIASSGAQTGPSTSGGNDDGGGNTAGNNLNSDKVIRKLSELTKRAREQKQQAEDRQKQLRKEFNTINLEIDSYNKQLGEMEVKEGSGGGGLQYANNAMKSSIH